MLNWFKGLGIFSMICVIGVLAISLTLIMPIIAIIAVVVGVILFAAIITQQYLAWSKEQKQKAQ